MAKEMLNFAYEVRRLIRAEFFICRKILWHGAFGFTYPPKEDVPRILSPLKIPSSSAMFKPANLGSNGKHASD
jgi:hypothetical protein